MRFTPPGRTLRAWQKTHSPSGICLRPLTQETSRVGPQGAVARPGRRGRSAGSADGGSGGRVRDVEGQGERGAGCADVSPRLTRISRQGTPTAGRSTNLQFLPPQVVSLRAKRGNLRGCVKSRSCAAWASRPCVAGPSRTRSGAAGWALLSKARRPGGARAGCPCHFSHTLSGCARDHLVRSSGDCCAAKGEPVRRHHGPGHRIRDTRPGPWGAGGGPGRSEVVAILR